MAVANFDVDWNSVKVHCFNSRLEMRIAAKFKSCRDDDGFINRILDFAAHGPHHLLEGFLHRDHNVPYN